MATFLTQQQEVASRLRLDLTQAAQATLVQRWLNRAQKEIWSEEDWSWTLDRQILQTIVDVTAGTVSIGAGSQSVVGVGTSFANSNIGSYIQFSSSNDWYKITAVASTLALTIESPYVGTSALAAGSGYTIRKMFYSLGSTVDQILDARQMISPGFVDLVDYREFDIFRPYPNSTGNPLIMVQFGLDSSGNLQVSLYPIPSQIENLDIKFKKKPIDLVANTDTSLIPDRWNETVMIDGALAQGYDYLSNGNAGMISQATSMFQKYRMGIESMRQLHKPDAGKHRVIANRDSTNRPLGPTLPYKYGAD